MALVTRQEKVIEVPHEAGEKFTFRPLTGGQLDDAELEATRSAMKLMSSIDRDFVKDLRSDNANSKTAETNYDKATLIKYGLVGWTYDAPCSDEQKDLLDAKTRDWAAETIKGMNVRPEEKSSVEN